MPEIKRWSAGENQCWCALRFIVLSYSQNSYSKDILMNHHDSGGLLVVLVIRYCVSTTEAKMEMSRLVEEGGHEVNASVGCKAEGKSTAVNL